MRAKILLQAVCAFLLGLGAAQGEEVRVHRSSVGLYAEPRLDARQIGRAYGNDRFTVLQREIRWLQVRDGKGPPMWIPRGATTLLQKTPKRKGTGSKPTSKQSTRHFPNPVMGPNGGTGLVLGGMLLTQGQEALAGGYHGQARGHFLEILLHYPGIRESYPAMRQIRRLLRLPARLSAKPLDKVRPRDARAAMALLDEVLLAEGRHLLQTGRPFQALAVLMHGYYEQNPQRAPLEQAIRAAVGAIRKLPAGTLPPEAVTLVDEIEMDYLQ